MRGAMTVDVLAESWELMRELECYVAAEDAEKARRARLAAARKRTQRRAG